MASKQREQHLIHVLHQKMLMEFFSIKMYKTRIKQWGLNKRQQHMVIRAVTNQCRIRHRVAPEGHSAPCPHGRVVTVRDVVQCRWCRQVVIDYIDIPRPASASCETMLVCFTSVPTLSTTPGLLGMPERIFNTIRNYYRGSFASGTWLSDQEGIHCWTIKDCPGGGLIKASSEYLDALVFKSDIACQLFANNYCREAGQALISATANIKKIVQAEHPMTLSVLFEFALQVRRRNRQAIAVVVLRYFSALAKVLLGDKHPLRQICGWLASVDTALLDDVIVRCFRSAVEHFQTSLGSMHRSTLESRLRYIKEVSRHEDINGEELLLKNLLDDYERILGTHDIRTINIRLSLADLYLKRNEIPRAWKVLEETTLIFQQARLLSNQRYYLRSYRLWLHDDESEKAIPAEAIAGHALALAQCHI